MQGTEEQLHAADLPQLRVFLGEDDSEMDDCYPPDDNDHRRVDWAQIEEFWAGRNHAGRRSARIAA